MIFLTNFADQAVVLPLALVTAIMLALTGWLRGAAMWLLAVVGTLGTIGILKAVLAACGTSEFSLDVQSPSGHTAAAAIVYGGLIALVARRCGVALGWSFLAAPGAVVLIGLSRIELGAHTLAEVAVGGAVGCFATWALLLLAGVPPPRLHLPRLLVAAVVVVVAMHGYHLPAENAIKDFGRRYAWLTMVCGVDGRPNSLTSAEN